MASPAARRGSSLTSRDLFHALVALPREAGTPAAAEARRLITRFLEASGYRVREQRFTFLPAALNVLPLAGAGLGWLTLLELPLLLWPGAPSLAAIGIWVAGAAALGVLAWGIGTGVEVPGAERREDANLIATRGDAPVRRWIVAHVDTKAQGHSMAGRLVAVWLLLSACAGLTLLALARAILGRPLPSSPVAAVAGAALAAGALAARGRLRGTSAGARDNGTGLLAALTAADSIRDPGVGFLFTGAEEFGLVGARAAARNGIPLDGVEVINLDTIDQQGSLYIVCHDARGAGLARTLHPGLASLASRVVTRRLPLGILTDSLPLAGAGAAAVTVSRLDWATLRLMHTAGDLPDGLNLSTAEAVGRVLAGLSRDRSGAEPGGSGRARNPPRA